MNTQGLEPREKAILTEIIEYYFAHHQAISARTLAKISHLALSPTSIRNLMEDLSEAGYLTPYGVARGRIPTQKAFYIYMSALRPAGRGRAGRGRAAREVPPAEGAVEPAESLEALLQAVGPALGERTGFAAAALLPAREHYPLDWVRFSPLGPRRVLAAVGTLFGEVWSKALASAEPVDPAVLAELERYICANFRGHTLAGVRAEIMRGEPLGLLGGASSLGAAFRLMRRAFDWGADPQWLAWGEERLFRVKTLQEPETLLRIHRALRDPELLPRAAERGRPIEGGWVAIGSETGLRGLEALSIVAWPFGWEGGWRGTIAVVGPMHMDYGRVLQTVADAAQALERHLRAATE
jgi:heat-inducible transcriptional repressor